MNHYLGLVKVQTDKVFLLKTLLYIKIVSPVLAAPILGYRTNSLLLSKIIRCESPCFRARHHTQ